MAIEILEKTKLLVFDEVYYVNQKYIHRWT